MPILQWLDRDKTIQQINKSPYRLLESEPNLSYGNQDLQNMLMEASR